MGVSRHPFSGSIPSWANVPIDRAAVARLKASYDTMAAEGTRMVAIFYAKLFERYPGVRVLFSTDIKIQEAKLMETLRVVVQHAEGGPALVQQLRELGIRHVRYGARPEHYPIVCDLLIEAMANASGKAWNEQLAAEWRQALEIVSRAMLEGAASVTSDKP